MTERPRDAELIGRARSVLAGPAQTYSKGPDQFVEGFFPALLARGEGCHVWDLDGNRYIDYPCALGPVLLGYCDPEVDAAIVEQLHRGMVFSELHPLEVEVAEAIVAMVPCAERVRFVKTGSEATSAAIRIARAATGRDHVAFCGYHGWHDWSIALTSRNAGVPAAVAALSHQWTYNDISSLERVFADYPGAVGAVIMEPVGVEVPTEGFLEAVAAITRANGAVLIFDEIITGFRLAAGGAQEYFGVTPDLAAFGKAVANGMPLAPIVGRRDLMEIIETDAFISSTFGGETLSLAAAKATLARVRSGDVIPALWRSGERLMDSFNEMADQHGVPAKMIGLAPRRVIQVSGEAERANIIKGLIWQECLTRGVLLGNANFVSVAHDDAVVSETVATFDAALAAVGGYLQDGNLADHLAGRAPGQVFRQP